MISWDIAIHTIHNDMYLYLSFTMSTINLYLLYTYSKRELVVCLSLQLIY